MDLKEKFKVAWEIIKQYGKDPQSGEEDGFSGYYFSPNFGSQSKEEFKEDLKTRLVSELKLSDLYVVENATAGGRWFVGITGKDRAKNLEF